MASHRPIITRLLNFTDAVNLIVAVLVIIMLALDDVSLLALEVVLTVTHYVVQSVCTNLPSHLDCPWHGAEVARHLLAGNLQSCFAGMGQLIAIHSGCAATTKASQTTRVIGRLRLLSTSALLCLVFS